MAPSNFNLRNITPSVMLLLKKEAAKQKISINSLLLKIIDQSLGITHPLKRVIFHDLDHLAGTWNNKEKKEFDDNIKSFEKIDEELWS